jgi:putative transcriptional regulator
MPQYHPEPSVLLDYAAGAMAEPFAVLVATHLTYCPECRAAAARLDVIGGALLAGIEPVAMGAHVLDATLAALDEAEPRALDESTTIDPLWDGLPAPLRRHAQAHAGKARWRRLFFGLSDIDVSPKERPIRARLMRVLPGCAMPRHSHFGVEMQVVLEGGYEDEIGRYDIGDFVTADQSLTHRPVADSVTGCVCFSVSDAPMRFPGLLGRALNSFLRY